MTTIDPVPDEGDAGEGRIYVIDKAGEIVWRYEMTEIFGDNLRLNDPARDEIGHIFIVWDPGRWDAVTILDPVSTGFEDFDTLPPRGKFDARFYDAEVVDRDGDGIFEIEDSFLDCDPDCAGGRRTTQTYRWDGKDYSPGTS